MNEKTQDRESLTEDVFCTSDSSCTCHKFMVGSKMTHYVNNEINIQRKGKQHYSVLLKNG